LRPPFFAQTLGKQTYISSSGRLRFFPSEARKAENEFTRFVKGLNGKIRGNSQGTLPDDGKKQFWQQGLSGST
jgi:hypothetical protein